jgi:succinate dehydrogenase (ubiquinone) cytochrome b560 subunit
MFKTAGRVVQRRVASTQHVEGKAAEDILVNQRLRRPVSPHLSIYRPQITWYASSFHRITGVLLSGGLYIFGFAYLAAPSLGWHLETPSMVASVAAWPVAAKVAAKFTAAWPFFFHAFNGLRHLTWDLGKGYKNLTVIRTGWTAVGLSTAAALYAAAFM